MNFTDNQKSQIRLLFSDIFNMPVIETKLPTNCCCKSNSLVLIKTVDQSTDNINVVPPSAVFQNIGVPPNVAVPPNTVLPNVAAPPNVAVFQSVVVPQSDVLPDNTNNDSNTIYNLSEYITYLEQELERHRNLLKKTYIK